MTISVVIPAYRAEATISAALRSVEAQTLAPLEIIVVDDGSPDGTAQLVAERFPAVRLVRQANQGCGPARNSGARVAAGDWLAFLDADDEWLPTKLERQQQATADPRVAVVTSRARMACGKPMPQQISFDFLWEGNRLLVCSALVRRTAFDAAGGFWAERACEDYHLWLRLAGLGWKIVNCPADLVLYKPSATSLSRQTASFAAAEIACVRDVAARFGLPEARLRTRIAAALVKHARGAIHYRDLPLARRLALASLGHGVSAAQLATLAIAWMPPSLLDLRRRLVNPAETIAP